MKIVEAIILYGVIGTARLGHVDGDMHATMGSTFRGSSFTSSPQTVPKCCCLHQRQREWGVQYIGSDKKLPNPLLLLWYLQGIPAFSGEMGLGQANKKPEGVRSPLTLSSKKAKRLRKLGEEGQGASQGTRRPNILEFMIEKILFLHFQHDFDVTKEHSIA